MSVPVDKFGDGLFLALGPTLVEERLEGSLKVEGHRAETSSFEEKVEFHVLFSLWCDDVLIRFLCCETLHSFIFLCFCDGFFCSYCRNFLFG